jgi:hypothetical protein
MIITCKCGASNRLPKMATRRIACGKCKHLFTPTELVGAKLEAPPVFDLMRERDSPLGSSPWVGGGPTLQPIELSCPCGWAGSVDACDVDENDRLRCPDCDKKIKEPNPAPGEEND